MNYFLKKMCFSVLPVLLFIYIITGYYWIFVKPLETGDIGRLGKISFGKGLNTDKHHPDSLTCYWSTDYNIPSIKYDIAIFGDSYANHETQKLNGFSNNLSKNYGYNIISFEGNASPEQRVVSAIQNNLIGKYNPKIILIESVGREFVYRLGNLNFEDKQNYIDSLPKKKEVKKQHNYLIEAKNWILLQSKLKPNPIKKYTLNKQHFTFDSEYANNLFVYKESILQSFDSLLFKRAAGNLLKLENFCKSNGYRLLYTVAPDNYDVYYQHIVGVKEAPNIYIEWIEKNKDLEHIYINVKQPLSDAVDEGKMDVYHLNDTHWNSVGAQLAASTINEFIKKTHNSSGKP